MYVCEINPFVRFAGKREGWSDAGYVACDHRIFIVENGKAKFIINNVEYKMAKGDIAFWRSGIEYRIAPESDAVISGCNFDFNFKYDTVRTPICPVNTPHFDGKHIEEYVIEDSSVFDDVLLVRNAHFLIEKFHKIYEEFDVKQLLYEERCSALLKEILMLCVRCSSANNNLNSLNVTFAVLEFIRENYNKPITNEMISEKFSYHANYISSLIKKQTGMPLHKYVLNYRINTALNLLQSTNYSVGEIATMSGFSDIYTFSRAFKKIIGSNPKSFRM